MAPPHALEGSLAVSLVLIGGGARSGKSRHALALARQSGSRLAFIATACADDDEMRVRIALHQRERGAEFTTFEEPLAIARLLETEGRRFDAMLVDCLTLWLSNMLCGGMPAIEDECRHMVETAAAVPSRVLLVTNEVGCGIVPENALARQFRDLAGSLNQMAAQAAAEVYWMAFGIPLKVK
jgi:adenosylcobinamide kinase/adenosylcobinamide-phosphate guanylyltransferase